MPYVIRYPLFGLKEESSLIVRLTPVLSRAFLVGVFFLLSSLTGSESNTVDSLVSNFRKVTDASDCVDEYTRAQSREVMSLLRQASETVASQNWQYAVLYWLALFELICFAILFIKDKLSF